VIGGIVVLGTLLRLLGISLICVLVLERFVLRRIPHVSTFLGLQGAAR